MNDRISVEVADHIADVRLDREDKLNALDPAMFQALIDVTGELSQRNDVRCVVLSGKGRGFCAGLDVASFMAMQAGGDGPEFNGWDNADDVGANQFQQVAYNWKHLPMPVIAALHGPVFGGGLQIALGADIRIAAPDARLSVMEIKWGLIPDMSGTQTLRDLVRLDVAKELTFTGRIVDADEALSLGLVTRVADDPLAAALALATEIAGKSPDAIRDGKQLLNAAWRDSESAGLQTEARLQHALIGTPNQLESVMANMQKRPAEYRDSE